MEHVRAGRPLSGKDDGALGLVREEVEGEVVEAAVELARAAAAGKVELRSLDPAPMNTPDKLPPLEIGHLSRAIDAILCRTLLEGCRKPLAEGLRFESEMFAACGRTEDMKIGLRNFLEHGPRSKAKFLHQ